MSSSTKQNQLLIIGICGVTCGGKSTTTMQLKTILPNISVFSQDNYFLGVEDPRHIWIPELNHINFDIITSLDMQKMYEDILNFIRIHNFERARHMDEIASEATDIQSTEYILNTISGKIKECNLHILIIEGFSIFQYEPMLNLFHLKYYFVLDKEECLKRRIKRVYQPPNCPGYFEKCAWPEYVSQLNEVKAKVKDVNYLDGCRKDSVEKILKGMLPYLQK